MTEMQVWLLVGGIAVIALFLIANRLSGSSKEYSPQDPLEEAEIFVAYGRRKQAIELLEAALQKNPTRTDIAARLRDLKSKL